MAFKLLDNVKVLVGRNAGEVGTITLIEQEHNSVYVDFNRQILVNEGFGSMANYDDGYHVHFSNLIKA